MRSKRLQREIEDLVAQGWRIEDEDRDRVVMVNREFGSLGSHLVVALLTLWWSMGLGNLAWGAYKYVTESQRRVLWEDGTGCPNCGATVADDDAYCPNCGADLARTATSSETVTCPNCEAVVTEGSRFCPSCGENLADATSGVEAGSGPGTGPV